MNLLKEVDIIEMFFRILVIFIGRYPRGSIFKLHGLHDFGPVNERKWGLPIDLMAVVH
jgi:hypothetical protein